MCVLGRIHLSSATNSTQPATSAAAQNRAGIVNVAAIVGWLRINRCRGAERNSGSRAEDPRAVAAQSNHRARPVDALYASLPSPPKPTAVAIITLAPSSVRLIALPRPPCCAHALATATPSGKTIGTRKRAGADDPAHHIGNALAAIA